MEKTAKTMFSIARIFNVIEIIAFFLLMVFILYHSYASPSNVLIPGIENKYLLLIQIVLFPIYYSSFVLAVIILKRAHESLGLGRNAIYIYLLIFGILTFNVFLVIGSIQGIIINS